MVNHFKGEGEVKVDGKIWRLRFDFNVLADLETSGRRAGDVLAEIDGVMPSIGTLRMVCHLMLRRHHPDATLEDAGDILSEDAGAVMAVIRAANPEVSEGNAGAKAEPTH